MIVSARSLLSRLRRSPMADFAECARGAAVARGEALYIVGGCVRDLILGVPLHDLDLAVEGAADGLAREVATRLGGRVGATSLFGTCRIDVPSKRHIDIAATRRDVYRHPGALPEVAPAGIIEDLARRDFTINALAVGLTGPLAGRLLDPTGGVRDLEARRLRLLHDHSLVEDPTRAFRGARYVSRFSLRTSGRWKRSLHAAFRAGAFHRLSPTRVRRELALVWSEAEPVAALSLCARWGLLRQIHPALIWEPRSGAALRRASWCRCAQGPCGAEALFALLACTLPENRREAFCARLGLAGSSKEAVLAAAGAPARAGRLLRGLPARPAGEKGFRRLEELAGWSPLALSVAQCVSDAGTRSALRRAMALWEKGSPSLSGEDLIALGLRRGPAIRRALRRLRKERIAGSIGSREEETAMVRSWLGRRRAALP